MMTKQDIIKVLETVTAPGAGKSLVEGKNIQNIQVFGEEVMIDLSLQNPTLQAKKKTETSIKTALTEAFGNELKVQIKIEVAKPEPKANPNLIKGKKIEGIQTS